MLLALDVRRGWFRLRILCAAAAAAFVNGGDSAGARAAGEGAPEWEDAAAGATEETEAAAAEEPPVPEEPEVLARLPKDRELPFDETLYVPPKVRKPVVPVYPYELLKRRISGEAKVSCLVDTSGRVVRTEVLEASRPEFGEALAAAVESMRFGAATAEGEPVATLLGFRHRFRPRGPRAAEVVADLRLLDSTARGRLLGNGGRLDRPLQATEQPAPAYPTALIVEGRSGGAIIEFIVDQQGRTRLPRIVDATAPAFGYAAAQAIAAWRFEPPREKGRPVLMRVSAPFIFNLR